MDSLVSEDKAPRPLRRSTRQSSVKLVGYEPTPRGPLKRTKEVLKNQASVAAVSGSKDLENGTEDEEPPIKKKKKKELEPEGTVGGSGDDNEMDVQESTGDLENGQDQEIDIGQDSSHGPSEPKICRGGAGDINLSPRVLLGERCRPDCVANEDAECEKIKSVKSTKGFATHITSTVSSLNRHDVPIPKITSIAEYKSKMESKAMSIGTRPSINHYVGVKRPFSDMYTTTSTTLQQRSNNIPTQKESVQYKKQGIKKPAITKRNAWFSCRGFMWYVWYFILLVLFSSAAFLAYKNISVLRRIVNQGEHIYRAVKPEFFADHLSLLEAEFPSQRPELWRRSRIHLEKHLKTANPTEPVSLVLTAGLRAERTLHCLAQGLASSFSSAVNASVLHINGASKAGQDSNQVKLDIDNQLQAAFEGDKPVAVIHRFEELPPGSTLIFYRYCDHENAAFKRVFLLFTVLLPQDEVSGELSLKSVEEMVQDYVQERLVGSTQQTAFNEMDNNKFGGLWSRISHLILPVVSEMEVEQKGC